MKLKKIETKAKYPIRSPEENVIRLDSNIHDYQNLGKVDERLKEADGKPEIQDKIRETATYTLSKVLLQMHSRGDPIEEIALRLVEFVDYAEYLRKETPDAAFISNMVTADDCGKWVICLLLAPDEETLLKLRGLVQIEDNKRLYAFDVLLKAFWPDWEVAKKYHRRVKYIKAWSDAFTKAMASDDREASLDRYMQKYERLVKPFWPFKWKPWRNFKPWYSPEGTEIYGNAYHQFAFEVALAVCAYDLDDEALRKHQYYPHELVDYYRKNIRHTRDAWREEGVGPGIPIKAPAAPKKINLAKSKSKNFKRWLELVGDGDPDATASVIATFGNQIRSFKEPQAIFEELSDNSIGICVDVKDDEALESALRLFIESRDLKGYQPPETENPGGFARCEELLEHARQFLNKTPYSLHLIDLKTDSIGAVIVRDEFEDEFLPMTNRFLY